MVGEPEVLRGLGSQLELIHRPFLPCLGVTAYLGHRKAIEHLIVNRVHGHQLALQVGRELGEHQAVFSQGALDLVAIGAALGGAFQIDHACIPTGNLHALIT
ncbi:hypothetical protein HORIV_59030 [Vreelandella olivaria]|uniref:Uncharacterized protein n=1 Tax=Vreelandella olivaria TaxID=390919 RepID=A0ABM7GRQ5_9GAMM|nr:hypothetical protein HORIV_59030 [Halomonas olivaria]